MYPVAGILSLSISRKRRGSCRNGRGGSTAAQRRLCLVPRRNQSTSISHSCSKGHNQHSLLSVGLTVWKSSLNDECNCVPDFIATSSRRASHYADDVIIYFPARGPRRQQRRGLTGSSDCILITPAKGRKSRESGCTGGGRGDGSDCRKKMTFKEMYAESVCMRLLGSMINDLVIV